MNLRKVLAGSAVAVAAMISVVACSNTTAGQSGTTHELTANDNQVQQFENSQPNPFFDRSEYRDILQKAETVQANGLQGTAFFLSMTGHLIYQCNELGSPVPNTAQLTNPSQPYNYYAPGGSGGGYSYNTVTIGNMDPNGVYSPNASEGTYVMCQTAAGDELNYWEGPVYSVSGPATWDARTQSVRMLGAPTKIVVPPPAKKKVTKK